MQQGLGCKYSRRKAHGPCILVTARVLLHGLAGALPELVGRNSTMEYNGTVEQGTWLEQGAWRHRMQDTY